MDRGLRAQAGLQQDVLLLLLVCWFAVGVIVVDGQNVSFSFSNNTGTLTCENPLLRCTGDAHTIGRDLIRLTADASQGVTPYGSTGWVFYGAPIRMMDPSTGEAASFSTNFSFRINRTPPNSSGADGIAFVMFANQSWQGALGGELGVYNISEEQGTKTFCVEYDTYLNPGIDFSDNHVGLDLESIVSKTYENASSVGIILSSGDEIMSWIDYNHSRSIVEVRIGEDPSNKPLNPLFSYALNLSTIVAEMMYAGFSASTGTGLIETHDMLSWSMSVSALPDILSPIGKPGKPHLHAALIGGILGGIALLILLVLCCAGPGLRQCVKRRKWDGSLGEGSIQLGSIPVDMPYQFTYKQLSTATNGFSEKSRLGRGGTSSVYRGEILSTGEAVAVKRVAETYHHGEKDFLAEISVVSRLRHRHLVKLLGWCADPRGFLLVYEIMPNGSLDKLLFWPGENDVLTWEQRIAIVKGVASGLAYLHEGFSQQVIHRDIKSSNVLLDKEFNALVGDFGLARLMEHSRRVQKTQLAGTIGYIAPETAVSGEFSAKTDVYAFGAVVLEVACGRPAVTMENDGKTLVDLVWNLRTENKILKAADWRLLGNFPDDEMEHVLLVGLLCSHPDSDVRPSMPEVELILARRVPLPPVPLVKPILQFPSDTHSAWMSMLNSNQSTTSLSSGSKSSVPSWFTVSSTNTDPTSNSNSFH